MSTEAAQVKDAAPRYRVDTGVEDGPPGYKRTEVGLIPEDWAAIPLWDIAKFTSGDCISVANLCEESSDSPVPVFGGNGVAGYTDRALVSEPTVVLGRVGQKCGAVYLSHGPAWITDNALFPRHLAASVHVPFLALALENAGLNSFRNRNDLPLLTQGILRSVRLGWPSTRTEQETIAEALSDVDELLGALEALIAKKRAIKQAAMHQLLTGKTRLPGFGRGVAHDSRSEAPNDWGKVPLHAISSMHGRIGWQGLKQSEFTTKASDPFLITGVDFRNSGIDWDFAYHVSRDRYDIAPQIQLRPSDVLVTKDGTIGKLLYVENIPYPGMATLNSHLLVLRPLNNAYVPRFLFYQLSSRRFSQHIEQHKSGSTFFGLSQEATGRFIVVLPSIDEQNTIATVLSDMDAEIAALERRRDKTRAIKQGMMQQLLTGRVRLV